MVAENLKLASRSNKKNRVTYKKHLAWAIVILTLPCTIPFVSLIALGKIVVQMVEWVESSLNDPDL